jgi:Ni/Fe-hydrogenase subunit HybB-like protein
MTTKDNVTWDRAVPVYGIPVLTKGFWILAGIVVVSGLLTVIREIIGLNTMSGMTDGYAWGMWKTFNVMVLTGLGSGAFAVGIGAWVFNQHKLHSVMRVALLTSFLAYSSGLIMLGIDVGRPWNFYWIAWPVTWNLSSPLLEVAVCITVYASIPLFLENIPPLLEYVFYYLPRFRKYVAMIEKPFIKVYAGIVALAYILPMMHQSSLGALMLLGGARVHTLWQSPLLPLLYVWAAAFLGYACVILAVLMANLTWKRPLDMEVMELLSKIGAGLIYGWAVVRLLDILVRGQFLAMFGFKGLYFAGLFWLEMALIVGGAYIARSERGKDKGIFFYAWLAVAVGGMIYRFSPTTLAFSARPNSFYFPNFWEFTMGCGYIALCVLGYLAAVKKLAILPGTKEDWMKMAEYEKSVHPEVQLTGYEKAVEN